MALDKIKSTLRPGMQKIVGLVHGKALAVGAVIVVLLLFLVSWYWSQEPKIFSVRANAEALAGANGQNVVTGYTTTASLYTLANT